MKPEYYSRIYNFEYFNMDEVIDCSLSQIEDFKFEFKISNEKIKYVEDKLFLHYLFSNILEFIKQHSVDQNKRVVLFITPDKLNDKQVKKPNIIKQLKIIKNLLPLPFIIPLESSQLAPNNGKMIEINKKCCDFYHKRKVKLKQLKKYFDDKGLTTLTASLSDIVNLKGFYY